MQEELELARRTHQRDMERTANEGQVQPPTFSRASHYAKLPCGMRIGFLNEASAIAQLVPLTTSGFRLLFLFGPLCRCIVKAEHHGGCL